jgi:predicted nucleotidyltransferase component of viral defense system
VTKSILSKNQVHFLNLFARQSDLGNLFYLTGGTALAEYYIHYRYSEDLDFFSEIEFDTGPIVVFLKTIKSNLKFSKFDINTSFNRNIIQLIFDKEVLKLEFTYFPFPQIDKSHLVGGVKIDSVVDIATNKLFTIYQNPRSRDYMDLYMICQKYSFKIKDILKKAKAKFDWHVDPVKLGSQFLQATEMKDYPKLITKIDENAWHSFFETEAKKLKGKILK